MFWYIYVGRVSLQKLFERSHLASAQCFRQTRFTALLPEGLCKRRRIIRVLRWARLVLLLLMCFGCDLLLSSCFRAAVRIRYWFQNFDREYKCSDVIRVNRYSLYARCGVWIRKKELCWKMWGLVVPLEGCRLQFSALSYGGCGYSDGNGGRYEGDCFCDDW